MRTTVWRWAFQIAVALGTVALYVLVVTRGRPADWWGG